MSHLKRFFRRFLPNPFDRLLLQAQQEGKQHVLILWNRGLGDIPLGLYALKMRIFEKMPAAKITILTRIDLRECFELLGDVEVLASPTMRRGVPVHIDEELEAMGRRQEEFDLILEKVDPTRWLEWQLGALVPKLQWDEKFNAMVKRFGLKGREYVGAHVSSETGQFYGYEKNWPAAKWREVISGIDRPVILFGMEKDDSFHMPGVIDLRGDTNLHEMIALIKEHCQTLIAPDSGVLSVIYYVNADFPLHVISLWSDPRQGVLRQNVPSPNPSLKHSPLIYEGDVSKISATQVTDLWKK
ncbi:MAG: hypothetical protein MRY21_00330 [Simkaniaceae bacterium]|nr:hypothetical protein [Simkaniaceae bacterium]